MSMLVILHFENLGIPSRFAVSVRSSIDHCILFCSDASQFLSSYLQVFRIIKYVINCFVLVKTFFKVHLTLNKEISTCYFYKMYELLKDVL